MKTRPTSRDIAEAAGVSQATVSRALRNSPLVRPETRRRILEIAQALNYRVDRSAAGLRTRHSRTLALLLFEETTADASQINPFFLNLLSSVTRAAAVRQYDVLVSFQQLSRDWVARYEASNRADGIILLGYGDYLRFARRLEALVEAGAHFVVWGPKVARRPGVAVGCDNIGGGATAARHLLRLGRRRIAFLGQTTANYPEFAARWQGYMQAHREAGYEPDEALRCEAEGGFEAGHAATQQLLARDRGFDAVFAASDLLAFGALAALREAGIVVPRDVSVVGFDDLPAAAYVNPALTTMRQDSARAGELLVANLIRQIEGGAGATATLDATLVIRDSCGGGAT